MNPDKPNVKVPKVWTNEVLNMAALCALKAFESMLTTVPSKDWLSERNKINELLESDEGMQREMYERVSYYIRSERGPGKVRAEARLLTWLRIYTNNA
jgi:hypothetical protein